LEEREAKARYRSKMRILADILGSVRSEGGEAVPTRILLLANLSYDRLQGYLSKLVGEGLLEEVKSGEKTVYRITERGDRFLIEYGRVEEFARAFGIPL